MQFDVETVTDATDELLDAFQRLIPQLTTNNPPPSLTDLTALVKSDSSTLLIARAASDSSIVGALSLTVYRVPTGIRAIIEDVIVDNSARGQGVGEALMQRAIEIARAKGASNIALTSNPMRETANRLYLRIGFKKRETNAYIYKF